MATTDVERNGQIIQYLCSIQAYVVSCCCEFPTLVNNQQNPDAPLADGPLLVALQAAYPTTGWTATMLVDLLLNGAKRGVYKRNVVGADTFWFVNLFLLKATPANAVYKPYCTAIKDCPFVPQGHPVV